MNIHRKYCFDLLKKQVATFQKRESVIIVISFLLHCFCRLHFQGTSRILRSSPSYLAEQAGSLWKWKRCMGAVVEWEYEKSSSTMKCANKVSYCQRFIKGLAWSSFQLSVVKLNSGLRAIFTWISKVICVYFSFALLYSVIGLKTRATFSTNHKYNQSQSWLARASFPALCAIASSSDWAMDCSASFVIGHDQSNYFDFGFTTLNWKPLYSGQSQRTQQTIHCPMKSKQLHVAVTNRGKRSASNSRLVLVIILIG